jgi:hypothetical protein
VTLFLISGEKLPARVLEREPTALVLAVVVASEPPDEDQLKGLVLEYSNPGGRVRMSGHVTASDGPDGPVMRLDDPEILEVAQDRRHVRVEAECPVLLEGPALEEPMHTHCVDLSGGGMLLAAPRTLYVAEQLSFKIAITPGTAPVTGALEVVRIDPQGRAGVHFTAISPADRWRLIRFTVECQRLESFRHPSLDGHLAGDTSVIDGHHPAPEGGDGPD